MRTIQEIFNAVINADIYPQAYRHMCIALIEAQELLIVTDEEKEAGISAITEYIKNAGFLCIALANNALPHKTEDCLAIYSNWDNRPLLWTYEDENSSTNL